jgi:hypothetical protein
VAKFEVGWVAKLVAHPLATAALWSFQTSLKNHKLATYAKEWPANKIHKKLIYFHQTYFYNPLVPAGTPEDLVHSLGSQSGLDEVADGHGANKAGQTSSLKDREKPEMLVHRVAKKVFPVLRSGSACFWASRIRIH